MSLNRQEQVAIVEDRSEELFRDHIGQFLLFAVSFLEFSEVAPVFCKIKKMHSRLQDKCYSLL